MLKLNVHNFIYQPSLNYRKWYLKEVEKWKLKCELFLERLNFRKLKFVYLSHMLNNAS